MDLHLTNKTVLVTGASEGIGKAIAMEYAHEGAHVYISSRSEAKLQKAKQEIIEITGNRNVDYVVCNVRDKEQINNMVATVVKEAGTIDVLINNAGGPPPGMFMEIDDDTWYESFNQNVLSIVRTSRLVVPHMRKQGEGRIVNITSSSMRQAIDQLILSNTFRPGILGLTKTMARELAKDHILVNAVGPGLIATTRLKELNRIVAEEKRVPLDEVIEDAVRNIPLGRLGEPEEMARIVVLLGSFANTYITGQALIVDGASTRAL